MLTYRRAISLISFSFVKQNVQKQKNAVEHKHQSQRIENVVDDRPVVEVLFLPAGPRNRGGSRGGVTSHPLARQPISCYYCA